MVTPSQPGPLTSSVKIPVQTAQLESKLPPAQCPSHPYLTSRPPGTVSAVLNDAPSARHIPKATRERIVAAAHKLDYRPNFFARSLRKRRTFTIGVIAHEIGDAYSSAIIAGIEDYARQRDYFFLT